MSSFSLSFTRLADPAWRELRRLDTDVASAILRRRLPGSMEASLTGQSLAITSVTVGELTSWTLRRNWGGRRLADLTAWRRHVVTLPFDDL